MGGFSLPKGARPPKAPDVTGSYLKELTAYRRQRALRQSQGRGMAFGREPDEYLTQSKSGYADVSGLSESQQLSFLGKGHSIRSISDWAKKQGYSTLADIPQETWDRIPMNIRKRIAANIESKMLKGDALSPWEREYDKKNRGDIPQETWDRLPMDVRKRIAAAIKERAATARNAGGTGRG